MPALIKTIKVEGDRPTVTVQCLGSGKTEKHDWQIANLSVDGLRKWQQGAHIQNAMPHVSADHREGLISGCCPKCWEELFEES